jgi:hypothetical protein
MKILAQWMACVLFGLVLFVAGCSEREAEGPMTQSPGDRDQPAIAGKSGSDEGTTPSTPGSESEMEQKPGSKEKQDRG